jgi:hypothetical protein
MKRFGTLFILSSSFEATWVDVDLNSDASACTLSGPQHWLRRGGDVTSPPSPRYTRGMFQLCNEMHCDFAAHSITLCSAGHVHSTGSAAVGDEAAVDAVRALYLPRGRSYDARDAVSVLLVHCHLSLEQRIYVGPRRHHLCAEWRGGACQGRARRIKKSGRGR